MSVDIKLVPHTVFLFCACRSGRVRVLSPDGCVTQHTPPAAFTPASWTRTTQTGMAFNCCHRPNNRQSKSDSHHSPCQSVPCVLSWKQVHICLMLSLHLHLDGTHTRNNMLLWLDIPADVSSKGQLAGARRYRQAESKPQ